MTPYVVTQENVQGLFSKNNGMARGLYSNGRWLLIVLFQSLIRIALCIYRLFVIIFFVVASCAVNSQVRHPPLLWRLSDLPPGLQGHVRGSLYMFERPRISARR